MRRHYRERFNRTDAPIQGFRIDNTSGYNTRLFRTIIRKRKHFWRMETNERLARTMSVLPSESAVFGAMAAIHMKHVAPVSDASAIPSGNTGGSAENDAEALPSNRNVDENTTENTTTNTSSSGGRGRRRAHGGGRKERLSMRTPVTFAHKLDVIDFFEANNKDINATMRRFYEQLSPRSAASRKRQIYKWVKERGTIVDMCFKKCTAGQTRRRDKGTATTLTCEAESELVAWIQSFSEDHDGEEERSQDRQPESKDRETGAAEGNARSSRGPLSMQMFREKALEIAGKYGVPSGSFQATWTWQRGFFKRHQMVSL